MKEINCNIIRDLLPLYEDDAVSQDTAELVREHLKDCPACREELRRMRAPVSVPLDGDATMLIRFEERMRKARRRRMAKVLCVVAVLVILAAGCWWYTRAQGLDQFIDLDQVTSLAAQYAEFTYENSEPGISVWKLDGAKPGEDAADDILAVLYEGSFHASLGNLFGPRDQAGEDDIEGTIQCSLAVGTDQLVSFTLTSRGTLILSDGTGLSTYTADDSLYHVLSTLIQRYGVLEESTVE